MVAAGLAALVVEVLDAFDAEVRPGGEDVVVTARVPLTALHLPGAVGHRQGSVGSFLADCGHLVRVLAEPGTQHVTEAVGGFGAEEAPLELAGPEPREAAVDELGVRVIGTRRVRVHPDDHRAPLAFEPLAHLHRQARLVAMIRALLAVVSVVRGECEEAGCARHPDVGNHDLVGGDQMAHRRTRHCHERRPSQDRGSVFRARLDPFEQVRIVSEERPVEMCSEPVDRLAPRLLQTEEVEFAPGNQRVVGPPELGVPGAHPDPQFPNRRVAHRVTLPTTITQIRSRIPLSPEARRHSGTSRPHGQRPPPWSVDHR